MALGFSSGLLSGLQNFGQGGGNIPTDPRQRNTMQAAGVTNPLLQQFGMGLGGLFGADMRSPAVKEKEQLTQSLSAIKDPSSYEGMLQMSKALMDTDPARAMQILTAAEEKRKTDELKGLQQQSTLTKINQSSLDQEKKNQLIKDYMTGIMDAKAVDAVVNPPKDYRTVEKEVVGEDGVIKIVSVTTDKNDPNAEPIIKEVGEAPPEQYKSPLDTAAGMKAVATAREELKTYQSKAETIRQIKSVLLQKKDSRIGGRLGGIRDSLFIAGGYGDELTVLRSQLNELRVTGVLDLLPKGPASDKDVQLALDATTDLNGLSDEELISYLNGLQKINEAALEYAKAKEEFIVVTEDPNALGFEQWSQLVGTERTIAKARNENPNVNELIQSFTTGLMTNPERADKLLAAARQKQAEAQASGAIPADLDVIGLLQEKGRLENLFEAVKKERNIPSFRGY
jgi:hypothetical protein